MELSESVSLFSLPAAHSAVLTEAGNPLSSFCFFLVQFSCLPTSCLVWYPLKGKNCSAYSIACFIWSEVSQYLGKPWFILRATGQCSPLGQVALGCRESVACPGNFLLNLSAGRKMSTDLGEFCLSWKVSFFSVHAPGIPAVSVPVGSCIGGSKPGQSSCLPWLSTAPAHLEHWVCVCVYSITPQVSSPAIWLLVPQQGFQVMYTPCYCYHSELCSHIFSSFTHKSWIPQQHGELGFRELLCCRCKACSLRGRGFAHTEGAEQAWNKTQNQANI